MHKRSLAPLILASVIATGSARAADRRPAFDDSDTLTEPTPPMHKWRLRNPLAAFPYDHPVREHYLRAALEVFTVLIVGNVDYLLNTQARGGTLQAGDARWDLRYSWPIFREKLSGEDWRVDTNRFNTNYISHPFAGTLYYTAARANHLNIAESFGYAIVGALAWEYFGELREEVSINDAIVTPVAGFAIGETLMQLSSFFSRGKKSIVNDTAATLFAPAKAFNDWADGSHPTRGTCIDELGFDQDVWHSFEVFAGAGMTTQKGDSYVDERFGADLRLANLPSYGSAVKRAAAFSEGNVSRLHFETTLSGGRMEDFQFAARVVPAGYYARDVRRDERGGLYGSAFVLGLQTSFEYSAHDYDRAGTGGLELLTAMTPLGVYAEHVYEAGNTHLRTSLELRGEFAGVSSHAIGAYLARHDDTNLQTVLQRYGYYHALGLSIGPTAELTVGAFAVGASMRLDSFRGLEGFDEQQPRIVNEISLSDQRATECAWMRVRIPSTRLRLGADATHRVRSGQVGSVGTSMKESSIMGTGEWLF